MKRTERAIRSRLTRQKNKQVKRCRTCKKQKSFNDFGKQSDAPDGMQYACKACIKLRAQKYYQKNTELIKANSEQWHARNPNYKPQNKPRKRTPEENHLRYMKRREKQKEWRQGYYQKYSATHREELNARSRQWQKNHPESRKARRCRRRAWMRAGGHFTPSEWRALCAVHNQCCLCCGEAKPLTPDHIQPLSRGGSNNITNIQPLCLTCNLRKGTKTIDYRDLATSSHSSSAAPYSTVRDRA